MRAVKNMTAALVVFMSLASTVGMSEPTESDLDGSTSASFKESGSIAVIVNGTDNKMESYYLDTLPAQVENGKLKTLTGKDRTNALEQLKNDIVKHGIRIQEALFEEGSTESDKDGSSPQNWWRRNWFYPGWGWGWGGGCCGYYPRYYAYGGYPYPYYGGWGWGGFGGFVYGAGLRVGYGIGFYRGGWRR